VIQGVIFVRYERKAGRKGVHQVALRRKYNKGVLPMKVDHFEAGGQPMITAQKLLNYEYLVQQTGYHLNDAQ